MVVGGATSKEHKVRISGAIKIRSIVKKTTKQ